MSIMITKQGVAAAMIKVLEVFFTISLVFFASKTNFDVKKSFFYFFLIIYFSLMPMVQTKAVAVSTKSATP